MDLVRKQANLARGNVTSLVRMCGAWFALRSDTQGQLLIRQLPVRASVRAHVSAQPVRK